MPEEKTPPTSPKPESSTTPDSTPYPALDSDQLTHLVNATIASYEGRAEQFWQGTKDHDVSQNRQSLLSALPVEKSATLLDFGCGPGRDLHYFRSLGHTAIGLDACATFCQKARDYAQCDVWQQNFLDLNLPSEHFHGIFANASLFHVPQQELAQVLNHLHDALIPGGVLFCSNPRGPNIEGWNGDRYCAHTSFEHWCDTLQQARFSLLDHYYRPPGKPRDEQPWLVTLWRKSKV
ncbi:MAG: SAM-dependent methyltransferase [Gammaproteobacteria bacterium]|nr:MAG: SAM-dependent methyltransferase [Gammaproteobacteria bacterium]